MNLFDYDLSSLVDLENSTPHQLRTRQFDLFDVEIDLQEDSLPLERGSLKPGALCLLPVRVRNNTPIELRDTVCLSYHLLSSEGTLIQWDNERSAFQKPLEPGEDRVVNLGLRIPTRPGLYKVEVDMVWEGVAWFKDRGGETKLIDIKVA